MGTGGSPHFFIKATVTRELSSGRQTDIALIHTVLRVVSKQTLQNWFSLIVSWTTCMKCFIHPTNCLKNSSPWSPPTNSILQPVSVSTTLSSWTGRSPVCASPLAHYSLQHGQSGFCCGGSSISTGPPLQHTLYFPLPALSTIVFVGTLLKHYEKPHPRLVFHA